MKNYKEEFEKEQQNLITDLVNKYWLELDSLTLLLQNWLGEWEYTDCKWSELMEGKDSVKIEAPKLNSNWKFKIK